jgi:poly-gamma-glutamate synthesis protein (capsule biosynthesis protein)
VRYFVGAHPHCAQPLDFYHGRPIAYSLGNLVFAGAPTVRSWNRGALLEVDLNEAAKISSVSLILVVLEDGLPRLEATESNRFGSR